MNTKSIRGVIPVWALIALAVAALGTGVVSIKKGLGIFSSEDTAKPKAEAVELVQANERLRAAEATAAALRAQADAAQAALAGQQQKRHEAVTEDIAGAVFALEQEADPSLNVTAALTLSRSAYRNSDPIAEVRLQAMREQVKQLTAQNATIRKQAFEALAAKDAQLDAARAKETTLVAEVVAVKAEKSAAEAKVVNLGEQFTTELHAHELTLATVKTLGQKIASFGRWTLVSAVLLVTLLWVLPIVAKAFPGAAWLAWIAKKAGALIAGGLHALHTSETRLATEGLQRIGTALKSVRAEIPEAAKVIEIFDRHVTDPRLQNVIAQAAGAIPPTT